MTNDLREQKLKIVGSANGYFLQKSPCIIIIIIIMSIEYNYFLLTPLMRTRGNFIKS